VLPWSDVRVTALLWLLLASSASAQPAESPPSAAEPPAVAASPALIAFNEGRALLEAGKYAEACDKFTASIKEDPDAPGTLLNLGLCNDYLGKTATALTWYRKAQFRSAETGMADYEAAAKQQTAILAQKVPTLRIEAPAGAKVKLDGADVNEIDRARIEIDPGTHELESGTQHRSITVKDGDKQVIDLRPPPPKHYVVVDHGSAQRRNAYLLAGASGVLFVASATLSFAGKHEYEATDHPETYVRWQNIVRYGGSSLFLAGTAALAGGVYLYIKAPKPERIEQIAPVVGPDQVGVAVAGSF